jgi:hypothetical protein
MAFQILPRDETPVRIVTSTTKRAAYAYLEARVWPNGPICPRCRQHDREQAHTNTVEGFYSIFKRGMKGVYQHCAETARPIAPRAHGCLLIAETSREMPISSWTKIYWCRRWRMTNRPFSMMI